MQTAAFPATINTSERFLKMTKRTAKRRSEIVRELSRLSQDGWASARPCDYEPLEAELRKLDGKEV